MLRDPMYDTRKHYLVMIFCGEWLAHFSVARTSDGTFQGYLIIFRFGSSFPAGKI